MRRRKYVGKWLRLTEVLNAFDYLEKAYYYIKEAQSKVIAWKWVILTLHSALYGFAICVCSDANYFNVTYKTKKGERKLIRFNDALKLCQTRKKLKLTDSETKSIKSFKEVYRNQFEHYIPKAWSIEIHGMPQMAIDVLKVIHFLAIETGNYMHLTQYQKRKIKSIIFQCKQILKRSKLYKESKKEKNYMGLNVRYGGEKSR